MPSISRDTSNGSALLSLKDIHKELSVLSLHGDSLEITLTRGQGPCK